MVPRSVAPLVLLMAGSVLRPGVPTETPRAEGEVEEARVGLAPDHQRLPRYSP